MLRRSLRIYAPAAALRRPAAWSPGLRCARARHASGSARAAGDDSAGLDRKSILKTESLRQTVAPVLATADGPHSPPADSPALVLPAPREVASSDTGPAPPSASFWQTAWKLVGYLGWDAAVLVLAAGLAVAAAALGVVGPIAVGKLWEAFSSSSTEGLSGPAVHLVAAYVGRFVLQWLSASLVGTATENAACRLRESLFASLLELDVAYFDAHGSAELAAPLADDVKEVRDALRTAISEGLPAAVRAVGSVVSMLYISPTLAIALGCGIPAAAYAGALYAARLRSLSRRSQDAQTRAAAVSAEVLANIRTVRAFTAEDLQRRQYHAAVSEYSALNKRLGMEITLFNSALSMGMSALAGIVLLYGGQMVQVGAPCVSVCERRDGLFYNVRVDGPCLRRPGR